MARIEGEIDIDRPVEDVFDFVVDTRNEPLYNSRMVRADKLTDGPVRLGTRFRAVTTTRNATAEMVVEVTEYRRPDRLASTTRLQSMDIAGTLSFAPAPHGTRMRWRWEITPHGFLRAAGPIITLVGRRQEQAIWAGLKRWLEADDESVGG